MERSDFLEYLTHSLRVMLTIRAEEIVRVTFSKEVYSTSKTDLRPQHEIDAIVRGMEAPIDKIVDQYVGEMKAHGLTSPELVRENVQKLRDLTLKMERDLEVVLKGRLGFDN